MSDILVANYVADDHLDLYIPGKLFEYAISNTPTIIGARGDAKMFIEKYKLGLVVEPSSVEGFIEAINRAPTIAPSPSALNRRPY